MNTHTLELEREFYRRGLCTAPELARALGVSQPTLSRGLAALPPGRLHRIGCARRTRYALHQRFEGLGSHWPLYQINEAGEPDHVAELPGERNPAGSGYSGCFYRGSPYQNRRFRDDRPLTVAYKH